ncbi:MAG TPA: carbohydrate binding family 9 domain-containing protein, partial [Gemmatimonadaceae bacterium]|nr:carbohydrate binding family 9 domain-containing protein [Gemmatimonadaceae bacterium]
MLSRRFLPAAQSALFVAALALTSTASAQTTPLTAVSVRAERAPVIDGRDDDAVWRGAPRVSDFRQFSPRIDTTPSLKTEFRAAYDERNLFVFVRMFDPHPDSILHALTRRDVRGPSDQIKILVDSYDDRRSGYEFAVNPDGVKRDFSMSNDTQEDGSWNGIWDVATRVDSL